MTTAATLRASLGESEAPPDRVRDSGDTARKAHVAIRLPADATLRRTLQPATKGAPCSGKARPGRAPRLSRTTSRPTWESPIFTLSDRGFSASPDPASTYEQVVSRCAAARSGPAVAAQAGSTQDDARG